MTVLRAEQLVYTRLEAAYSPRRRSGFQTVGAGTSLTPVDVDAIERRIQCYWAAPSSAIRRQFFSLSSGRVVLAQTVSINGPAEIVDRTGRGAFLAHCLILGAAELVAIDYNPFAVFDRFAFLRDVEIALTAVDLGTGETRPVEVVVDRADDAPVGIWAADEAGKLAMLAIRASTLLAAGRSVNLVGMGDEIAAGLRIALSLTRGRGRLACSFDTAIDRCPTPAGLYWAVGSATQQSGESYIHINVSTGQVAKVLDLASDGDDPYHAWFVRTSARGGWSSVIARAPAMQRIADAFDEPRDVTPIAAVADDESYREFYDANERRIMRGLEVAIARWVGPVLATKLGKYMRSAQSHFLPDLLTIAAAQAINPSTLGDITVGWIVAERPDMRGRERVVLQDLARAAGNARLLHLIATVGRPVDAAARDEALDAMDAGAFGHSLEQLEDPIPPAEYVAVPHLPALLERLQLRDISSEQFVNLVAAMIAVDAPVYLNHLATGLGSVGNKHLTALERAIEGRPDVPAPFVDAVAARRTEVGARPRFLGLFRAPLPTIHDRDRDKSTH